MILGPEDLTLKRFLPGSWVAGDYVAAPAANVAATATISAIAGPSHVDTETFVLGDGVGPALTFEFDWDGLTTPGNIPIDFTAFPDPTADDMAQRIRDAINGQTGPAFQLAAALGASPTVVVTHQVPGAAGNAAVISEQVADAGFTVTAFSGGQDSTAAIPFTGSMQPAPGYILQTLTESERSSDVFVLFTTTELRTADVAAQTLADRVTRVSDSTEWEVRRVTHWPRLLSHYECVLVRMQETE